MLKKAGPFKYKRVKVLPSDTHPVNTRFYIMTDRGNFWCPPFKEPWITFPELIDDALEINNVFAVRLDLKLAAKCHLNEVIDIDIGETIAFQFDIPLYTLEQSQRVARSEGDDGVRGPAGQPRPSLRFVYGQDGKLAISGMAGNYRVTDDKKRGPDMVKLQRDARPSGKTLPVRPAKDETPDAKD